MEINTPGTEELHEQDADLCVVGGSGGVDGDTPEVDGVGLCILVVGVIGLSKDVWKLSLQGVELDTSYVITQARTLNSFNAVHSCSVNLLVSAF